MSLDIMIVDTIEADVFSVNITHNLNKMAAECGLYKPLWRPEELGVKKAGDLISHLERGLNELKSAPEEFESFNPRNGWGCYETLVEVAEAYLTACKKHPNGVISVCR